MSKKSERLQEIVGSIELQREHQRNFFRSHPEILRATLRAWPTSFEPRRIAEEVAVELFLSAGEGE